MYIVYISKYRKKLILLSGIIVFWVCMFFAADYLINNRLIFNVTIDNCFEFSYPYGITVDNILVSENAAEKTVQSSYSFSRPAAQEFSNYNSLAGKFSFDYPSAFIINPQKFQGSDILYHIGFHNKPGTAHGFVQVWNMPLSLDEFLSNSKAVSQQRYKYFKTSSIEVNNIPGFFWDYSVLANNTWYKGNEVFMKEKEKNLMYRISYFVPEADWDDNQSTLFKDMVKSFKTY